MTNENKFSSKIGFILAAAGSAVGLGNIWRFPYLAAKYGGGTFLLTYIVLALTFGFALMLTEISLGRKTGKSVLGAFTSLNKKYSFIGYLAALVPIIIFPYYCVIGGWVSKYLFVFLKNELALATSDTYFLNFTSQTYEPIFWLILFIIITTVIVMFGVQKGIERASKFLMPALIALTIFIAIYGVFQDGAMEGVIYYLKPDFSKFSLSLLCAALGQLFYSMSLAMGIMVTYGSYMSKKDNLESSVTQIELFDTGIAILSGIIIVPAVFAFSNGDPTVLSAGPSLMFITLPKVFANMKFGSIIGTVFFILVLFAALTSAISLMETIVSIIREKFNISRVKLCTLILLFSILLGVPSSLGFGALSFISPLGMSILDFFDFISNNILMPVVALLTCLFIGYVIKPKAIIDEVMLSSSNFRSQKSYSFIIKYVAPIFILLILISSILNALGIITL